MPAMLWRLHRRLVAERLDEVIAAIESFGDSVQVVDGIAAQCAPPLDVAGPALALTTIQDAKALLRTWSATPGLYYHADHYRVSYWLPRIPRGVALNACPLFVPAGLLPLASAVTLSAFCGDGRQVFIKPDGGDKAFAGQSFDVAHGDDWAALSEQLQSRVGRLGESVLLAISPAKALRPIEWRFWIVNGKVVASSGYSWDGPAPAQSPPAGARAIADAVADHDWQIDVAYTADVVEVDSGGFRLCELNAASTSGLYDCDVLALLGALRDCALREVCDD